MKKFLKFVLISFSLILLTGGIAAYAYWGGKTMTAAEVKEKWGSEKHELKKFRDSSYDIKSKMAYSVMTDKSLIGKSYEEIRDLFGPNDGYYFTDTVPAYIIQRGKSHAEDTWQLVFRMDRKYNVREIIMHKNCCER